jgi:general secretion pathway protein A
VNKKLLSLYGLKWNPFAPDVPTEALYVTPRVESFCWRAEQLAGEGGFALVTGYEKEFIMGSTAAHTVDFHD